ncbi:Hsp20/alpha crystallin family protein [Anaerovorax odorimutans]|uniref:Hsp20/alpha crystallin family protein n=1 Tax=Anaerovorax odorimutans TaxID=109327 RepID=UPI000402C69D|nr:Hsp20/alpha crystallin family protein [Anaerovorax odorimutans]
MYGLTPFNKNILKKNGQNYLNYYDMLDDFFDTGIFNPRSIRNDTFKMDIKEEEKAYIIEAEMPGINRENISIDYENENLTIGVKSCQIVNEEEENNYIHKERRATSMHRSVYLKDIDVKNIDAKLENGILIINIPKLEVSTNKLQIEVK